MKKEQAIMIKNAIKSLDLVLWSLHDTTEAKAREARTELWHILDDNGWNIDHNYRIYNKFKRGVYVD